VNEEALARGGAVAPKTNKNILIMKTISNVISDQQQQEENFMQWAIINILNITVDKMD